MKSCILRKRHEKLQDRFAKLMSFTKHFDVNTHFITRQRRTLKHVSPELVECVMTMMKLGIKPTHDVDDEIVNLVLTKVTTDVLDE